VAAPTSSDPESGKGKSRTGNYSTSWKRWDIDVSTENNKVVGGIGGVEQRETTTGPWVGLELQEMSAILCEVELLINR